MLEFIISILLTIYLTKCFLNRIWWEILERKRLARVYTNSKGRRVCRLLYKKEIMKWNDFINYDFSVGDRQHEIEGNNWLDED